MQPNNNILKAALRQCSSKLLIVIFFGFFINLLMFVAPLHMLQMYDRVLVSRSEVTLIVLTLLAIGLLMVYGVLDGVRSRLMTRIGLQFDESMSDRMLNMVFDIAVRRPSITSPQQLIRDVDSVRDFIGGQAIIAISDAPWVPIFIAVCFILHPVLGFISLFGAILVFALAASNEWLTKEKLSEANRLWIKTSNQAAVSLKNSEIVKALGMIPGIKNSWTDNRNRALGHQSTASDRAGAIIACSRFIRMGLQVVILAAGGYLAINDEITPGTMIAASIIMGRALAPVEMAVAQWRNFIGVRDAYKRINDMVDNYPSGPDEVMELPPPVASISLESIYVVAPEQPVSNLIIRDLSLNFVPGTITAIIGPSGCGKSSLVRAIVGVWATVRGAVRIDGAKIENWRSEKLGPYVGYMPQDVELFGGTVAQNICRFQDVNSQEIIAAAQKAGVHELVLKLPDGYDTNIGTGGQALSGGQRQRIALARALYMSPRIIVLDEPNSNLDSAGEKALADAMIGAKNSGATVIVVSHRPSLLSSADNIAVLNQGQLVKVGPRDQILSELGGNKIAGSSMPTPANS
jgi:PrtD family type I secretion system ABC transporter